MSEMSKHLLHRAVAEELVQRLPSQCKLLKDEACGGRQHLPLFVGTEKSRSSRMCCVDLLILTDGKVRGIIEIEESGFLPTKICGKFLQAALATHYIHESQLGPIPYAEKVFFLQVLDASKCLKTGTSKDTQAQLIEKEIQTLLPLRGITDYRLLFVSGQDNKMGLAAVDEAIVQLL
jgi:hypothetical protein